VRSLSAALFHARHVIESETTALVARLDGTARIEALARLEAHLEEETNARAGGQTGKVIRLSGEFHRLLAELAGNPVLTAIIADLVWRTALALATHAGHEDTNCSPAEHPMIVAAIRTSDAARAVALMTEHLHHVAGSVGG